MFFLSPITYHLSPSLLFFFRRRGLFVCDPRDEEAQPVINGFADLDADARRAVDGGGDADDLRGDFDWSTVGLVRAKIETLAPVDLLVEMKERAGGRDVVRFRRLAPGRAVLRAPGHDDGQTQRHAQREASLFVVRRHTHKIGGWGLGVGGW